MKIYLNEFKKQYPEVTSTPPKGQGEATTSRTGDYPTTAANKVSTLPGHNPGDKPATEQKLWALGFKTPAHSTPPEHTAVRTTSKFTIERKPTVTKPAPKPDDINVLAVPSVQPTGTAAELETKLKQLEDVGLLNRNENLEALHRNSGDVTAAITQLLEAQGGSVVSQQRPKTKVDISSQKESPILFDSDEEEVKKLSLPRPKSKQPQSDSDEDDGSPDEWDSEEEVSVTLENPSEGSSDRADSDIDDEDVETGKSPRIAETRREVKNVGIKRAKVNTPKPKKSKKQKNDGVIKSPLPKTPQELREYMHLVRKQRNLKKLTEQNRYAATSRSFGPGIQPLVRQAPFTELLVPEILGDE